MFAFLKAGVGASQREEESPHISLRKEVAATVFHSIFLLYTC